MADVDARLAAVEAIKAMRLPISPVEQMIAESVADHPGSAPSAADSHRALGRNAARLIWEDGPGVEEIQDLRTAEFAQAVVEDLAASLAGSPGVIKKMMRSAAAAAEDLNVGQFQGLIEVVQNADDVGATEVRFALRETNGGRQLLVVHNGLPVTCHNVLGMALPFVTTKTHRLDQRGRFGIGLKTLRRVAKSVSIHSAPYHFSGDQLSLASVDPEAALPGFYEPWADTLLILDLRESFDETDLVEWFDAWDDDGLLFLSSVGRFRWCTMDGETVSEKALELGAWEDIGFENRHRGVLEVTRRRVRSARRVWTVWKAAVSVPKHLHPAHKARSETTDISVAIPDCPSHCTLYIGFKTRVPVGLTFSLDAQFDPSTAREQLIENPWNNWLIERCGDVVAEIASGLLVTQPQLAWAMLPLDDEHVGNEGDRWLRGKFNAAFTRLRADLGESACIILGPHNVPLRAIAYEDVALGGFLALPDVERLSAGSRALSYDVRDSNGRWREVLDLLAVSTVISTAELLQGFDDGMFADKEPIWWVQAAQRSGLFRRKFWLGDDGRPLSCRRQAETDRPLVLGEAISGFAARWKLLDRLHETYGSSEVGDEPVTWLLENAAFTTHVDAATELAAFAEHFARNPIAIEDADLREIRDRFDELPGRRAEELGRKVGAALLLDGYAYKSGKQQKRKVSPPTAYLSRTLDSDHPDWPSAAGTLPGINWIAARYDEQLKTGATRTVRRRADGIISRGPRKFLMLLGAEVTPRLVREEGAQWGGPARVQELRAVGAEQVDYDYTSPDLDLVLEDLQRQPKAVTKVRSPALLRALSRNWERLYSDKQTVPSEHVARRYVHPKGPVTAIWLNELRETSWVAVGRGELVPPSSAVIRTIETQTLYHTFVVSVEPGEVAAGLAAALKLITDVRIGDLLSHLEELRDGSEPVDDSHVLQVYRTVAKRCPRRASWNTHIGELTAQDLRRRFSEGTGLIYGGQGVWRRPDQLLRGKDIFHDRRRFVPGGSAYANLWAVLGVREPSLDDCITFCRELPARAYDVQATAVLMDVYRYMEPLLASAERKHKERLKKLPVACFGRWIVERPIYFVEDSGLREELMRALPRHRFWTPPCDTRDLPSLIAMIGVTRSKPELVVVADRRSAMERGELLRIRFGQAVDHLSDELARNDPATREKMLMSWDGLKSLPLFVYDNPVAVRTTDRLMSATPVIVSLKALIENNHRELHVCEGAIGDREYGGRAIASLFPAEVRRRVDGEWALAWQKSREKISESIRLASDEELSEALEEQAGKINAAPKNKIKVTPPASRVSMVKPRTLKEMVGPVAGASVNPGSPPNQASPSSGLGLAKTPPEPSRPNGAESQSAPLAYTNTDLEQRGWEILVQALNTAQDERLVDFRKRHGVGADGAINWKTFVEMKATGRGPQTSVEMSNSEYERARERGTDFILALVSGLETGRKDEVRLIIDPANRASVRPVNGVRLVGLLEAPSIVIHFQEADEVLEHG